MVDISLKKIEERIRKSFIGIREDIGSLRGELASIKNKEGDKELEKNILDLTSYVSGLKGEIKEIRQDKQKPDTSDVKTLIEFNELKSQISDLKESIENIKFPKQEDYSQDINDIAGEIGELKGSAISKKYLDKEILKTKEKFNEKLKGIEVNQKELEISINRKAKQPLVSLLKSEVKQLRIQTEEETQKYESLLSEMKKETLNIRKETEKSKNELREEIVDMKRKIAKLYSATPEERKQIIIKEKVSEETKKKIYNSIKFLAIIIPFLLIGYIAYSNFIASQDFNYLYDIGSEEDNYLSPVDRISENIIDSDENYKNLTGHLVYFDVPIPRGSDNITIEFRYKNNFPKDSKMAIGARDMDEWNYIYNWIFNESSVDFDNKGEWLITSTSFNMKDLYIKDGKLSLLFNVPHLAENANKTNMEYIPLDWIKITIHKDGII
jgi:hypothetical protein